MAVGTMGPRGGGGGRRGTNDPNYGGGLIMNIDKVYDIDPTAHYGYGIGLVGRSTACTTAASVNDDYEHHCLFEPMTSHPMTSHSQVNTFHYGVVGDCSCSLTGQTSVHSTLNKRYRCTLPAVARVECEACLLQDAGVIAASTSLDVTSRVRDAEDVINTVQQQQQLHQPLLEGVDLISRPPQRGGGTGPQWGGGTGSQRGTVLRTTGSDTVITTVGKNNAVDEAGNYYPPELCTPPELLSPLEQTNGVQLHGGYGVSVTPSLVSRDRACAGSSGATSPCTNSNDRTDGGVECS